MTATDERTPAGAVTRHWGTASTVRQIDLTGIAHSNLLDRYPAEDPFTAVPLDDALAAAEALTHAFVVDMNALSERGARGGTCGRYVADVELQVQIWRGGYEKPMFATGSDYLGWCFLEVVAPREADAGTIAVFDPRAGSAMTAMPGLPWGRQLTIAPVSGSLAVVPGWLTCSIVPVEKGEAIVVVVAQSIT
ncbi:hypothetical protein [Nonomuraea ceibae]|uniref:hypothetical protein n=1 Tax=Nonomuraea ceibae TaxID=1935170 RepID=UPI001C5FF232|nr:hypothetical protein [Nonomuraea ceibae]